MTPRTRSRGRADSRSTRRWLFVLAGLALLLLAPIVARAQGAGADSVTLSWTAPGDDGSIGTATSYEVRMSTSSIDASSWASATVVSGAPTPRAAGTLQSMVVRGLTRGTTYWFAIKTRDEANNLSNLSNVVRHDWTIDAAPPAAPTGTLAARSGADVNVTWNANAEPDLAGYRVYRSASASGPWTLISGGTIAATQYLDTAVPPAATTLWYAVTALDASLNESARGTASQVTFTTPPSNGVPATWALETGYPNPSRAGSSVTIPVAVPAEGAASARLEIVDGGGGTIRRLELGALTPGQRTVTWDGRNDAGREVAPGPYTAWLIADGSRQHVRLVRQP
jgi:hypothetical protein